jgi:hypothetical protein
MRDLINIISGDFVKEDDKYSFLKELHENAPPGKKAKNFIKHRKKDFQERYGDAWEQVLYATANKLFRKKHVKETSLNEAKIALKSVDEDGNKFNVYENPTLQEMQKLLDKSVENELRGILYPNKFFIWDSFCATHAEISHELDLNDISGLGYEIVIRNIEEDDEYIQKPKDWEKSYQVKKYAYIEKFFIPIGFSGKTFILKNVFIE